jgi:predicted O-methyltransferase YrrM
MFLYNNNIPGWMSGEELNWLFLRAKEMDSIAEIGSWKGRSTHALLTGCRGSVYAVDHFLGSPSAPFTQEEAKDEAVYNQFMENVGEFPNLVVVKKDSLEAALEVPQVDMVFIDADHTYEDIKRDIKAWMPKAKKLICGHDYDDGWPGIIQGVDETFEKVEVIGSIWAKWL